MSRYKTHQVILKMWMGLNQLLEEKRIPNWLIKQSTVYIYTGDRHTFKKAGKKSMGKTNKAYKNNKKNQKARSWYQIKQIFYKTVYALGLPRWHSGKESAQQCRSHRRCGFDLWVRKIMATHFGIHLENPHGQRSLAGCSPWNAKSWRWLNHY